MDPVAAAIARTEPTQKERRLRVERVLPTGRGAVIDVPADLDVIELLALVSFVATGLPQEIVKARESQPTEPIVDRVAELRRQKNGN